MKYFIFFFLQILTAQISVAQNMNSIWCFGDSAGIDFSSGSPTNFISSVKGRGSCVSIADKNGQLLFYGFTRMSMLSSGIIYDRTNNIMQSGDSLIGLSCYEEMTIVNMPLDSNKFYLFHTPCALNGLFYSMVDMSLNNGLGAVIQKNIQLLPYQTMDCLKAIKHGNGRDWWLITRRGNVLPNDSFYIFLITSQGISGPYIQQIGPSYPDGLTKMCFNSDGTKLMLINYDGLIEEYFFDRCTGVLSLSKTIHQLNIWNPFFFWSVAYSPNDRFLYVTSLKAPPPLEDGLSTTLLQLDLSKSNPWYNRDTLWYFDDYLQSGGFIRLAPDNKIYLSCWWVDTSITFTIPYPDTLYNNYITHLGVIDHPNKKGAASDFQPFSYYLGGARTYVGLPNNPNYEMGPLAGSLCDTLTGIQSTQSAIDEGVLNLTYIHEWQKLFINAQNISGKKYFLQLFDVNGKCVYSTSGKLQPPYFTKDVDIGNLSNGMYIVHLAMDGSNERNRSLNGKFIK